LNCCHYQLRSLFACLILASKVLVVATTQLHNCLLDDGDARHFVSCTYRHALFSSNWTMYEWNLGCRHCSNVEVLFAFRALCVHFGLAPTWNSLFENPTLSFQLEDPNYMFPHMFPWGLVGISAQFLVAPNALLLCSVSFVIVFSIGNDSWLVMGFAFRHNVTKKCQCNLVFSPQFITTWTYVLGLVLTSQQHKMYLEQHVDLKNLFFCPLLWSVP
jgi:hypothetical protein